ncbi:hypothetical protein LOD99_2878 [Oopsacas minuta]|uniref:Gustatory receptor n=1 Tax=Oopsacas minuta TaxID=111878 RepID=A0AAV7JZ96_9METZ|nr:hypothetical protein LOD99_2878 [Oopsacas minuta]
MNSSNISVFKIWEPLLDLLDQIIDAYAGLVIGISILVSGFWVIYLFHELVIIKRRYKRALNDVRDFETEAILKDLKSRFVKHVILILICFFEINAAIFAFVSILPPIEYAFLLFYFCVTSSYFTFCLLNILTTYLIRVYLDESDPGKDKVSLILFISKLLSSVCLPIVYYFIILSILLIEILFIWEFVRFIQNGKMLDRVISWIQQDLSLEFGSERRVLAIKRMRRRFRFFKCVFITCYSFLILAFPSGLLQYYLEYLQKIKHGNDSMILAIQFEMPEILYIVLAFINDLLKFSVTILAPFYLIFTIQYLCPFTCGNIYQSLRRSMIRKSQHSANKPLLPSQ